MTSDQEMADHLLLTHFPGCQPIMENTSPAFLVRTSTEEDWLVASEAVDSDKIRWAMEGFGSFKSVGEDGIFPARLKNGIEILSGPLAKIFTACLALGYIPEAWQKVKVIFIPKPGRTSYQLAKSFRPRWKGWLISQ
jgi:hypothetical protein